VAAFQAALERQGVIFLEPMAVKDPAFGCAAWARRAKACGQIS
jgi:hypothetical protein